MRVSASLAIFIAVLAVLSAVGEGRKRYKHTTKPAILETERSFGVQDASVKNPSMGGSKDSWEECIGLSFEEAKAIILNESPGLNVVKVPQNAMVTMDYVITRVRVFVDDNGMVARTPRTG
mmetsp:Transcript_33929/g.87118  ORF Transcript_33929/g.87118 Transcript_33929/m.87118 type:complete len:121 (+) Transcript_33929:41-403(+)